MTKGIQSLSVTPKVGRVLFGLDTYFANNLYPYANFIKGAGYFSYVGPDYTNVNASQYPITQLSGQGTGGQINIPTTFNTPYTGNWVLKWTGTMAVQLQFATITSVSVGSFTDQAHGILAATSPRVVFTFTALPSYGQPGSTTQRFNILGANSGYAYSNPSGLILCRLEDEAAIDTAISTYGPGGDSFVFNPDFISFMKSLKPLAFRTLGVVDANDGSNNGHQYNYRAPLTSISWWDRVEPNIQVGVITNTGGTPETYTCGSYVNMAGSWTHLETFTGYIASGGDNTTTTPHINVAGRGAKQLVGLDAYQTGGVDVGQYAAGTPFTFVYDATLDQVMTYTYTTNGLLRAGPPIEVLVALANQIGCDLYFVISHLITDLDAQSISSYVSANLNPGLKFHVELSNEIWNHFGAGESQGYYFVALANKIGFANGYLSSFGLRMRQVFAEMATAWAPRSRKELVCTSGVFSVPGAASQVQSAQFNGVDLGAYGYATAPNRPIDFIDVMAIAPYWGGAALASFQGNFNSTYATALKTASDNYASGNPVSMASALDFVYNDIVGDSSGNGDINQNTLLSWYTAYEAVAASYDVAGKPTKFVVCYEGGPSFWFPGPYITAPNSIIAPGGLGLDTAPPWVSGTTYSIGDIIISVPPSSNSFNSGAGIPRTNDLYYYTSVINSNIGNDPSIDNGTNWTKGARSYSGKIYDLSLAFRFDERAYKATKNQFLQMLENPHFIAGATLQLDGTSQFSTLIGDLYSTPTQILQAIIDINHGN